MDERVCFAANQNLTQAIILKGTGSALAGVYMLQQVGDIRFYERVGKGGYIYQTSNRSDLEIGIGESFASAKTIYRREGKTVWKSVGDESLAPQILLTPVPDAFNTSLLEEDKHFEEETTIPGVGMICFSLNGQEKTFISFKDGRCDGTPTCQFGGNSMLYNIS